MMFKVRRPNRAKLPASRPLTLLARAQELIARAPQLFKKTIVSINLAKASAEQILSVTTGCFANTSGGIPELGLGDAEINMIFNAWERHLVLYQNAKSLRRKAHFMYVRGRANLRSGRCAAEQMRGRAICGREDVRPSTCAVGQCAAEKMCGRAHVRPLRPQGEFRGSPPDNPPATSFIAQTDIVFELASLARRPQGGFGGSPPDNTRMPAERHSFATLISLVPPPTSYNPLIAQMGFSRLV
jgi:hypothetical protein